MQFNPVFSVQTVIRYTFMTIALMAINTPTNLLADISDINGEIDKCSKQHGYNPDDANKLGANQLGINERAFLNCVYSSVEEVLVPKSLMPDSYKNLIAEHKKMTDAVENSNMTRQQRTARVQEMLEKIKYSELAESEKRIQDLSAKRDRFLRERERMLKRNPRMF